MSKAKEYISGKGIVEVSDEKQAEINSIKAEELIRNSDTEYGKSWKYWANVSTTIIKRERAYFDELTELSLKIYQKKLAGSDTLELEQLHNQKRLDIQNRYPYPVTDGIDKELAFIDYISEYPDSNLDINKEYS